MAVTSSDLQRIPSEKLESSTLRVIPTAVMSSGGSITLPAIEMLPASNEIGNEIDYFEDKMRYFEISRYVHYEKELLNFEHFFQYQWTNVGHP